MNDFSNNRNQSKAASTSDASDETSATYERRKNYINSGPLPVYQQPWWINIARRGEQHRELRVMSEGKAVASLPFVIRSNKLGLKLALPPVWSRMGGPVVDQALGHDRKSDALQDLILQLPSNLSYKFVVSPTSPDAELIRDQFIRARFEQTSEATYLQWPSDPGIMERVSSKHKKHFQYAERDLEVTDIAAHEFTKFYADNLKTVRKTSYASLQNARDLIKRGQEGASRQVRVTAAKKKGQNGIIDAAIACVWDDNRYYLWMLSRRQTATSNAHENRPHRDAVKLLILRATEHARELNLVFDADGASSGGAQKLFSEILRFPHREQRDVFTRHTKSYELYLTVRTEIMHRKSQVNHVKEKIMGTLSSPISKLRARQGSGPSDPQ